MMDEFFIDVAGNLLTEMRLIVEGAVNIYETDAAPLTGLAMRNNMPMVSNAFNTIGAALYDLLKYIRELQEAHMREIACSQGDKENITY